jgi:hypothetical protein
MAKQKKEVNEKKYFTFEKINGTIFVIEHNDSLEEVNRISLGTEMLEVGYKSKEFIINMIMKFFS